jgi:hypothetical protein
LFLRLPSPQKSQPGRSGELIAGSKAALLANQLEFVNYAVAPDAARERKLSEKLPFDHAV